MTTTMTDPTSYMTDSSSDDEQFLVGETSLHAPSEVTTGGNICEEGAEQTIESTEDENVLGPEA